MRYLNAFDASHLRSCPPMHQHIFFPGQGCNTSPSLLQSLDDQADTTKSRNTRTKRKLLEEDDDDPLALSRCFPRAHCPLAQRKFTTIPLSTRNSDHAACISDRRAPLAARTRTLRTAAPRQQHRAEAPQCTPTRQTTLHPAGRRCGQDRSASLTRRASSP